MIDVNKFVFENDVENNPLIGVQLTAMKYFGYMIFEYQQLKRLHCFRGVVFTVTFILFNLAQNSTDIEAPLILPCWFPFDDYWKKFWIIFGIEYYIMNIGMLIVPCWHSFIVSMMGYVIINLKILNYKLSNMREIDIIKFRNVELIKCVDHRERLVCFIRELSSLISSSLFLDFIIFSLLLCMLLFQASQVGDEIQLCIIACYIITMTTILWMYYYHSNEITYFTDQLSSSSYHSSWYEYSQSFKKQVLIFMMSAKPIMLRAGFIDMKLDTFLNILRASYSYFTLLTQMAAK
ncbi:hypothetical protein ACKWTF_011387 [Chironomus riparius]